MDRATEATLERLRVLWRRERDAVHQRTVAERQDKTLAQRVEEGIALRDLAIVELGAAPGDRTLLWLRPRDEPAGMTRLRPGHPVRLWWDTPDSDEAVLGTVARWRSGMLGVMIDGDPPAALESGGFNLDRDDPQTTFARADAAISASLGAPRGTRLRRLTDICLGDATPEFARGERLSFYDEALHEAQRDAVALAMRAEDIALIHGPPGTGKTRTLVEVIRQALARGERVLACAASNMAVDNLAARLVQAGVEVVRIGHPARVHEELQEHTLDAMLERHEVHGLARGWLDEANAIRRRIHARSGRNALGRDERRAMYREANGLTRDARRHMRLAQQNILSRARVLCMTATGIDERLLGDMTFDLVVMDEATQAADPITLIPFTRAAGRVVLAGDPHQLPPTVIDEQAARDGLADTMFARMTSDAAGPGVDARCVMLVRQHRMHEVIMAYPSARTYGGRLIAAPEVAAHRVEDDDIGALPDPLRDAPLIFIDTAGKGWEEELTSDDPSTSNPGQAARTAAEVRRLLSRGLRHEDIGVISPYNAQLRVLRALLVEEVEAGLELSSVDGFQGREKEVIVLDLVRSNDRGELGFLRDLRRMNVAITRARRLLLLIGDSATLSGHAYFAALFDHIAQTGLWQSAWSDEAEPLTS